ncbi:hypothetical protein LWH48_10415 [Halomonas sp. G15]|uniref:Uncharacterized protein n=1 Tax=Halomonas alimentaria TaxID=147248 RepID=A0A7X4W6Q0_9GAMM|nr:MULTISPECIES: hypothetical protein [Halomonas]MCE0733207.1 hypothetical protein [Halomonas sp. G15]NAW35294.1 hypothetical protein [Halomonas alimentaria]
MNPDPIWSMITYVFNILGMLVCLGGLTLAHTTRHVWPGRVIAGAGFLLAASPTLYGLITG